MNRFPDEYYTEEELLRFQELENLINHYEKEAEDGFDMAFVHGLKDVLKGAGDGGISENYFKGLKTALATLNELYVDK